MEKNKAEFIEDASHLEGRTLPCSKSMGEVGIFMLEQG